MRRILFVTLILLIGLIALTGLTGCGSSNAAPTATDNICPPLPKPTGVTPPPAVPADSKPDKVELVYFHKQNPCHCMAVVGDNIKYAVDTYFKNEISNGKLKLTMIVSDDPANAKLVKQYNAMLFVLFVKEIRGDKERIYPVDDIWEMTGDDNRDTLVEFMKTTITGIFEGKS